MNYNIDTTELCLCFTMFSSPEEENIGIHYYRIELFFKRGAKASLEFTTKEEMIDEFTKINKKWVSQR